MAKSKKVAPKPALNKPVVKSSFSFIGVAKKIKVKQKDEIAVWTDGIMASCDLEPGCAYRFKEGKMYQITIECVG